MITNEDIAKIAHETNAAYCCAMGDYSQPEWSEASESIKKSALNGVEFICGSPEKGPSAQHEAWLAEKIADGWIWGPEKNVGMKTHPCIVPYHCLPKEQRAKDHLFQAVVRGLLSLRVKLQEAEAERRDEINSKSSKASTKK